MRVLLLALALAACGQTANEAPAPAAWETRLLEMLPYIDACLERSPSTRWITYAGPIEGGRIAVQMSGEGAELICTMPAGAPRADAATVGPYEEHIDFVGDGSAIFVRGPGENPGGECYEAPEVRDANGEVIGWMADPEGC